MTSLLRAVTRSADDNLPTDTTDLPCTGYRADLMEWVEEVVRYTRCIDCCRPCLLRVRTVAMPASLRFGKRFVIY